VKPLEVPVCSRAIEQITVEPIDVDGAEACVCASVGGAREHGRAGDGPC
jgi:hypothetical protein